MLFICPSAVIWWMTTSGSARMTACITAPRSRPSATAGSAPIARSESALCGERVIATTSWPPSISAGTRRAPTAPLAPATKTFMVSSFVSSFAL
jgi:hypothetical protein